MLSKGLLYLVVQGFKYETRTRQPRGGNGLAIGMDLGQLRSQPASFGAVGSLRENERSQREREKSGEWRGKRKIQLVHMADRSQELYVTTGADTKAIAKTQGGSYNNSTASWVLDSLNNRRQVL